MEDSEQSKQENENDLDQGEEDDQEEVDRPKSYEVESDKKLYCLIGDKQSGQKKVILDSWLIKRSKKLVEMMNMSDQNQDPDDESTFIELEEMTFDTFDWILEYYKYYIDKELPELISQPIIENKIQDLTCEWDAAFIDRICGHKGNDEYESIENLVDLLNGANALDLPSLLDLTAAKIASLMTNREPEFIRRVFELENDFTEAEYQKICEENKWAEEATKIE